MSTFYDALKKAEAEHKKTAPGPTNIVVGQPASGGGMSDTAKTAILAIAVVCVFGIAIYRFVAAKAATESQSAKAHAAAVATPAPKPQRPPGTYNLDGIVDAGDNSMAIINGKLLKAGESLDALILKKVSPDQAELLNTKDNSMVILKLNP